MKKRRVSSQCYGNIIDVGIPVSFYLNSNNEFDVMAYDTKGLSKHEKNLMNSIMDELTYYQSQCQLIEYIMEHHMEEWLKIIDQVAKEESGMDITKIPNNANGEVPRAFLEAFGKDDNETVA